ncbi:MAG: bifunctional DNA-formamidopyrimidine glycosylase/DNA-(apurinic or apyrimidinic site) lyase [Oscillospiraceae bacterium]|nr:bifunctional DNA-formamidopyrimidine glycosylase/DNA-(apurinic or apyrimidinic site) lyase [Oscillospiraceae bacterium]MDD4367921.1 bifunctional DNA-formamidopyrimidine glycosylase/DNA-(apurinic or apyrimidinic site) lyase [Oscillospiraceae bacterium]
MPELPEVETIRLSMLPHLQQRQLAQPLILRPGLISCPWPGLQPSDLDGCQSAALSRRGKYLLWRLQKTGRPDTLLILHFGMTGEWLCLSPPPADQTALPSHTHLVLPLLDSDHVIRNVLIWRDIRRFGKLIYLPADRTDLWPAGLKQLGPEPLGQDFTPAFLNREAKRHQRLPMASFLLNQSVGAGLGNIYVNEALFLSQISPLQPAGTLSADQAQQLCQDIRRLLTRAIASGGSSLRDYRDADGRQGHFQEQHLVYGRGGQPCPRCGQTLVSHIIGGRRVISCPHCQPWPKQK